ncbi:ANTAR domain-containing protein [Kaistia defluvii]|uniref:ANTAR domain-containing response regulator n=1 Tax=Kaistia defluvii TaxID=410841 RepID=UPI002257CFCE|nr:ANTAR domain-containing protein [Kaistia defluvii]MCX5517873.1 ANTAR domain-containing protein [Kaistia defluvii]
MTAPRLLQNFKGSRALIVTTNRVAVEALESTLVKLGVVSEFPEIRDGRAELDLAQLDPDRDILFVDGDLHEGLGLEGGPDGRLSAVPVIGLVGVEAPSRLKSLVQLGATSFLRKPVHGSAVYMALFLGVNQFLLRGALRARIEDMERRRHGRRFVIKAIIRLMSHAGIDDDAAYDLLRRESMRSRLSLEDYCEEYLRRGANEPIRLAQGEMPEKRANRD